MKYQLDHDYHIHSQLSTCSSDPAQTTARILQYGEENHYKSLCLTDHYWDESVSGVSDWYAPQNTSHILQALPLPQGEHTRFYFGCETEMDRYCRIGISPKMMEKLDFVIIPTTHLHMHGFTVAAEDSTLERRAELYVERLDKLLRMDLPFEKIGVAHLTCPLMAQLDPPRKNIFEDLLTVLDLISDDTYRELYGRMAKLGVGFEINFSLADFRREDYDRLLRPYRLAKEVGCKFYIGSDAHGNADLDGAIKRFTPIIDALDLQESDKFYAPFDRV